MDGVSSGLSEDKALVPMSPVAKAVATSLLMLAAVLVVLDQTIATVALPHMQAALGATPDTVSWVLTSYIIASAVAMPLTGWLTGRYSRSRMFGVCVIGFTISSAMCGLSVTLPMMVVSRLVQGTCGAFIMPLSQAFLYDMNPPSTQVRAVTIWGVGSMAGPLIGPVLGGYLTDMLNWRWVFFINVPIGIVTAAGIFATLPEFPSIRRAFDHVGFIMIAVALSTFQLALDRGTQQDWFDSTEIVIEVGVCLAAFWMLFFHLRSTPSPIISIGLFRRRTFTVAMILALTVMPSVIAATALMPSLLQVLLGYPVVTAGLLLVPRSATLTLGIILGGRLMNRVDLRAQVIFGLILVAVSLWMQSGFDLMMDANLVIVTGLIQGLGAGLTMTVVNVAAIAGAPAELRAEAAAVFSLFRGVGGAMMISITAAVLAHNIQVNHAELGALISTARKPFMSATMGGFYPAERIAGLANAEVTRQAMMIAFVDDFWMLKWLMILLIPLALLVEPKLTRRGASESAAVAAVD
jgi:DHA2 family multidrug resistance protein